MTASAHSLVPPLLTVMPPPPRPPAPDDDGGFSPLPAPRPPSTELGRAHLSSQHDGRQLMHSTTILGSGSIVDSVASAPLVPSHRRELQTAVSTVADLTSALANTAVGRIVLASGTYYLTAELSITRSVVLEAAVAGSVVLHAQAISSSPRRVLNINPGSSGVVQVIGLNITGGYFNSHDAGGGVYVTSGTVTITSSSIYGNTANNCDGGCGNSRGGGVVVAGGTVTFSSCTISGNTARNGAGGGIWTASGSTVTITSSSIYGNTADYGNIPGGGGIGGGGTVSISSSTISGNIADYVCTLMFKTSHRPDGNITDELASTLACAVLFL